MKCGRKKARRKEEKSKEGLKVGNNTHLNRRKRNMN